MRLTDEQLSAPERARTLYGWSQALGDVVLTPAQITGGSMTAIRESLGLEYVGIVPHSHMVSRYALITGKPLKNV